MAAPPLTSSMLAGTVTPPRPTPVPLERKISVPRLVIATLPDASLKKPVFASLARCGLVALDDVPSVRVAAREPVILLAGIFVRPEPSPLKPGEPVATKAGAVI